MGNEPRKCIDCGVALAPIVRGRPPLRCGECHRGRNRIKVRATQTCLDCGAEFAPPAHTGLPPKRCAECREIRIKLTTAAKAKRWRDADPERQRASSNRSNRKRLADPEYVRARAERLMFSKFGLTPADFDVLLESQGGVCAICKGDRNGPGARFHVDHDHTTGLVRGLLCGRCNTGIGLLQDSPEVLRSAADYLSR